MSRGQEPNVALERRFDAAMLEIYERAGREVGYWATRYLQMLRRRGGLDTARHLLAQRVTSDGYARLRDAGRLDLTVEAHCLQPEFASLFTAEEQNQARERLAYFGELVRSAQTAHAPDPELARLLDEATKAPSDERIQFRSQIARFGAPAISAVEAAVRAGLSPGFAVSVIEAIGQRDKLAASHALRRLRPQYESWAAVIDGALARLNSTRNG